MTTLQEALKTAQFVRTNVDIMPVEDFERECSDEELAQSVIVNDDGKVYQLGDDGYTKSQVYLTLIFEA